MRTGPVTRYTSVGSADVAYQVSGSGPHDLVYLSGVGNLDVLWDYRPLGSFLERLGTFCRVITFDRRGVGLSDRFVEDDAPTWEQWIEDLSAVLDEVSSDRATLYAQLDAGPTAMLFAATHPARTTGLVLATTTARYLVDDDYPIGMPLDAVGALGDLLRGVGHGGRARALVPSLDGDSDALEVNARLQRGALTPTRAAAYYEQVVQTADVRGVLSVINVPTLILHPTDFALLPVEHGRWLAGHIEGARLVEVPGRDSWFVRGAADMVIDEIAEFMTGDRMFADVDRVLATILFTDIVASTETAARLGDRRWRAMLDLHDAVVREQLERHRGREVNTTGDGFVASFDVPGRAIRCPRAIREHLDERGISIRIGLHTGECEARRDDLGGLSVHIAARVAALAGRGDILTSSTVRDLLAGSDTHFEERGEHELKGVPGVWRIFAVGGA